MTPPSTTANPVVLTMVVFIVRKAAVFWGLLSSDIARTPSGAETVHPVSVRFTFWPLEVTQPKPEFVLVNVLFVTTAVTLASSCRRRVPMLEVAVKFVIAVTPDALIGSVTSIAVAHPVLEPPTMLTLSAMPIKNPVQRLSNSQFVAVMLPHE